MKETLDLFVEAGELWQIVNDIDSNDEATERVHRVVEICSGVLSRVSNHLFRNDDPNSIHLAEQLERISEEVQMVTTAIGIKKINGWPSGGKV